MLEDFGRKKHTMVYFAVLGMMVFLAFIVQSSLGWLPKLFGVYATPLLPLVIAAGFFNREVTGFSMGLTGGILMDVISDKLPGFHTLLFVLIGLGASLLAEHLINRRFFPCFLVSLLLILGYFLVYFLAFDVSQGLYYFFRISLVQTVYTWLYIIPFYYLFKWYSKKLLK